MKRTQENKNVSEPRAKSQPLPKVTPCQRYVLERMREDFIICPPRTGLLPLRLSKGTWGRPYEAITLITLTALTRRGLVSPRNNGYVEWFALTALGRAVLQEQP